MGIGCGPIFIRLVRVLSRQRIDAAAQMSLYRPEFFGDPMWTIGPEVLRGPSYWTPAEREYRGVRHSRLNECPFCVRSTLRRHEWNPAARLT